METTLGDATERAALVILQFQYSNLEAAGYRNITRFGNGMEIRLRVLAAGTAGGTPAGQPPEPA
jgi:hypothetical protein